MAQWLTPGAPGSPVDGRWIEYPVANAGNLARWDATGAIYSTSGWIDVWGGPIPSAIGAAVWGPVSGYEIAEIQSPAGKLMLVLAESGGAWTLTVRAGSETGTVLASAPWTDGQRIAIGATESTCHVRSGTMDFSIARTATAVFFCFPEDVRLRDVQVGTWPLPAAVTIDSITLDGPLPGARAVTIDSITLDGPLPPGPQPAAVTIDSITLDGPVVLAVHPDPANPAAVGPGEPITLLAALADDTTADTWAWRRVSGPAVTLLADGPSCQITGPSIMPPSPQLLVLGVRATVGAQTSPETQVTVRVLPQVSWTRHDAAIVGRRTAPA